MPAIFWQFKRKIVINRVWTLIFANFQVPIVLVVYSFLITRTRCSWIILLNYDIFIRLRFVVYLVVPKRLQIFFWHLKGNDLLIKERTVWANLLISYVLQDFGISYILILNVNLFIISIIISFWFWFSRRLQCTIRLVECEMQINSGIMPKAIPSTWRGTYCLNATVIPYPEDSPRCHNQRETLKR